MGKDKTQAYEALDRFKKEVAKMLDPNCNYDYYNKKKEVVKMSKWLIAYKTKDSDKWMKYCYSNTQRAIPLAIEKLFSTIQNIETIQIKKVVV